MLPLLSTSSGQRRQSSLPKSGAKLGVIAVEISKTMAGHRYGARPTLKPADE
jgi:hypothetical protein